MSDFQQAIDELAVKTAARVLRAAEEIVEDFGTEEAGSAAYDPYTNDYSDNEPSEDEDDPPKVYEETYEGETVDGLKHGQGMFQYSNGDVYVGEWKADKRHGQGKLTEPDGTTLSGIWEDDEMHCEVGTFTLPGCFTYEGSWVHGQRNGKGTLLYVNGQSYVGNFTNGNQDGFGKSVYVNGDTHEGQYSNGDREGEGTYICLATGKTFTGPWHWDQFQGDKDAGDEFANFLTVCLSDDQISGNDSEDEEEEEEEPVVYEESYEGKTVDGLKHGQGKFQYSNGDVYVGEWKADKRHGQGKLTEPDGTTLCGTWEDDEMHCEVGVFTIPGRFTYEGPWVNGQRDGKGTVTYENGQSYTGDFTNGNPNGNGKTVYTNGDSHEGQYSNGNREGKGTYTCLATGKTFTGPWHWDQFQGDKDAGDEFANWE